jgi:hypothetical protein
LGGFNKFEKDLESLRQKKVWWYLSARETHSAFAHSMGARQVQLESIRSSCGSHASQLRPIRLVVAAHDAGDQNLFSTPHVGFIWDYLTRRER